MRLLRALVIDHRLLDALRLRLMLGRLSFDSTVVVEPSAVRRRVRPDAIDLIVARNAVLRTDPAAWLSVFRALFADAPPPIIVFNAGPSERVDAPLLRWAAEFAILAESPTPDRLLAAIDRVYLQGQKIPLL